MSTVGKALLLCLCLTACSGDAPPPWERADVKAHVFDCGELSRVTAEFVGQETLLLVLPDGDHTLERSRSASGARYIAGDLVFWNKGDEALLVFDGTEYKCMLVNTQDAS